MSIASAGELEAALQVGAGHRLGEQHRAGLVDGDAQVLDVVDGEVEPRGQARRGGAQHGQVGARGGQPQHHDVAAGPGQRCSAGLDLVVPRASSCPLRVPVVPAVVVSWYPAASDSKAHRCVHRCRRSYVRLVGLHTPVAGGARPHAGRSRRSRRHGARWPGGRDDGAVTLADDLAARGCAPVRRWRSWWSTAGSGSPGRAGAGPSPAPRPRWSTACAPLDAALDLVVGARDGAPLVAAGRPAAGLLGPRRRRAAAARAAPRRPGGGLGRGARAARAAGAARPGGSDLLDLDARRRRAGAPGRPAQPRVAARRLGADWTAPRRWAALALRGAGGAGGGAARRCRPAARRRGSRRSPCSPPWSESAAALLAVELEQRGLPLDRARRRGAPDRGRSGRSRGDPAEEAAQRTAARRRGAAPLPRPARRPAQPAAGAATCWSGSACDLPDTRSWRLEPHAATRPAVAALLALAQGRAHRHDVRLGLARPPRRSRRAAARAVARRRRRLRPDDRPRRAAQPAGGAAPGGAGRARRTCCVRADLGQVEPRVLAAVSGDAALARAAREDDMYAPVAAPLRCDRPTAKVAVLAAMYGQTSGTAGAALRDMDRAYPVAMAYLRAAEEAGRARRRTSGRTAAGCCACAGAPRRPTPSRSGSTSRVPGGAGRFARNAVVQGAAAELFKAWAATVRDGLVPLGGADRAVPARRAAAARPGRRRRPGGARCSSTGCARRRTGGPRGSPVRFVADGLGRADLGLGALARRRGPAARRRRRGRSSTRPAAPRRASGRSRSPARSSRAPTTRSGRSRARRRPAASACSSALPRPCRGRPGGRTGPRATARAGPSRSRR